MSLALRLYSNSNSLTKNQILQMTHLSFYEYVRFINYLVSNNIIEAVHGFDFVWRFNLTETGRDMIVQDERSMEEKGWRECIICGKPFYPCTSHMNWGTDHKRGKKILMQLSCGSDKCKYGLRNNKKKLSDKIQEWVTKYGKYINNN
jgi:hypothetical protein